VVTTASITPTTIVQGATAAVATDLVHLSDGSTFVAPPVFNGIVVTRSAVTGTVTPATGALTNGVASPATYSSTTPVCNDTVTVTVDREVFGSTTVTGQPVTVPVCVQPAAGTTGPTVTLRASRDGSIVYRPITVTARVSGLLAPYNAQLKLSLYGPFRSARTISCSPAHLLTSKSVAVAAPGATVTATFTPKVRGQYAWVATLPGNATNAAVTTRCGVAAATTRVLRATPSLLGHTSDRRVSRGEAFHEVVQVRGKKGSAPTLLKVTLHGPSDGRPVVRRFTLRIGANGTYQLPAVRFQEPGTYVWRVRMKGDETNQKVKQDRRQPRQTTVVQGR
jgi:hypothetical protein